MTSVRVTVFGSRGLVAGALLSVGCATLSPMGRDVERVTDRALLKSCVYRGDVSIVPSVGSEKDDIIRLRNEAVGLGGTAIWLESTVVPPGGRLYASVFDCRASVGSAPRP